MPHAPEFSGAAVSAPHDAAARTGRNMLALGANAIEAAVAMAATLKAMLTLTLWCWKQHGGGAVFALVMKKHLQV